MQAALAGGKAKKKKWNKGKMREKINAKVLFDEDGWNRLQAEVPKVQTTSDDSNVAYSHQRTYSSFPYSRISFICIIRSLHQLTPFLISRYFLILHSANDLNASMPTDETCDSLRPCRAVED